MSAEQALDRFMAELSPGARVLDIGAGGGKHATAMRLASLSVTTIDIKCPADVSGDYLFVAAPGELYQAIWASHVVEHQRDVGAFLRKVFAELEEGGLFAVTVPPMRSKLVGGHLNQFTEAGLVYNLICAGFDCARARVGVYGYNISVLVRKQPFELPALCFDTVDIKTLSGFFPWPVHQAIDGALGDIRW